MTDSPTEFDDLIAAVADIVDRTGAISFGLRYQDDDEPVVWLAVATYPNDMGEADAALSPGLAAWRLAQRLIDGGTCTYCGRPTTLIDAGDKTDSMFAEAFTKGTGERLCVYRRVGAHVRIGCQP